MDVKGASRGSWGDGWAGMVTEAEWYGVGCERQ
jgi:hypothetical protein